MIERLIAFGLVGGISILAFFFVDDLVGIGMFIGTLLYTSHGIAYEFGQKVGTRL